MNHRALSIAFLKASGVIPVRVRPNQKDPFPEWDPRRAALENHAATLELLADTERFDLNIGGLFHGRWADVDVDTKEDNPVLRAALDTLLPKTKLVFGRESKPESHRLYMLTDDFDRAVYAPNLRTIKQAAIDGVSFSVEIRGGKPENGMFTVLPGSTHPSGERVEWAHEVDTTVSATTIPLWRLIKQVRMAQAIAMIVPFWTEGIRNDLSLALSGLLWRIREAGMAIAGYDVEDEINEDEVFILKQADAELLMQTVMQIAGDDEKDLKSRMINMVNTWRKLDQDSTQRVSGGKILAATVGEGGEALVKSLYRLLSDNDGAEQLEALCEQFYMWYGQGVLIDSRMVEVGLPVPWMSREQASNSLAGQKIRMGDKKVPVITILFATSILQRVYGLTFDPSTPDRVVETQHGIKINQWRGFELSPSPQAVSDHEVGKFIRYVHDILAPENHKLGEWILDWCADILQDPSNKPGTSLVLVGAHGAGKTFLGEHVMSKIIGPSHSVQVNSIESLTKQFNALAENKVFVQCDEAMHSHQKEVAAKLKSLITDETMTIEQKFVNSYKAPSHSRFLFTSNDEQTAVFIDPSPHERRYTVGKVSPKHANDIGYWEDMHAWIVMALPKIMRWLLDRKYDKKTLRRPIETEAKRELQRVGVDPEVSWIISRVTEGFPLDETSHEHWWQAFHSGEIKQGDIKRDILRRDVWPNLISIPALQVDLRNYIRKHGRSVYSGSMQASIRRVLPPNSCNPVGQRSVEFNDPRHGQPVKERVRLYSFPPKESILIYLRDKFGPMIDSLIEAEKEEYRDLDFIGSGNTSQDKEEF